MRRVDSVQVFLPTESMGLIVADNFRHAIHRISEQLWVRPAAMGVVSVFIAVAAHAADGTGLGEHVPSITADSIDSLLGTMSSSMLVIATFAVASMVAAYASASSTATPRAFTLVIADDVSQNALSAFIGAFIFSIVARIALANEYFGPAGRFVLFVITLATFAIVIITFVRWVDRIARLGRVGATIDNVEDATLSAVDRYREAPTLGGRAIDDAPFDGAPVLSGSIGYLQRIDVKALQRVAEKHDLQIIVDVLPGDFIPPGRAVARVAPDAESEDDAVHRSMAAAFKIGQSRRFEDDPRFGAVVLSETASRALSPGVNDPGTALQVLASLVRIFARWTMPVEEGGGPTSDRVQVPTLSGRALLSAAIVPISRDGAGLVEVATELQRFLSVVQTLGDAELAEAAAALADEAFARAVHALHLEADVDAVRAAMNGAG